MIPFFLLTSLLLWLNVACYQHHCLQSLHIRKQQDWSDKPHKTYKGLVTSEIPISRLDPFVTDTEAGINKQINWVLYAHYNYLSMAYHFLRDDINLPGFHKFFKKLAEEEMKHAHKFMEYQNKRGGRIKLHSIMKPCKDQWGSGLDAMRYSLALEKSVYISLLDLHELAESKTDPQLTKFLESHYLEEQVESIKELSNYVNTLKRLNETSSYALGEYQFDKITLGGGKSESE